MSELFLETKRPSVKCHRKKHDECKNQKGECGCNCHRLQELQNQLDEAFKKDTSHMEALSY